MTCLVFAVRASTLVTSAALLATVTVPAATALAGEHFQANACEIFVDRIGLSFSSHGSVAAHFFLKTLNARLDSPIAEVGARTQQYITTVTGPLLTGWRDERATSFLGAADYFELRHSLGSDYSESRYQTAFFARTTKGTTYWVTPRNPHNYNNGGNFGYDRSLFHSVLAILGLRYASRGALADSVETRGNDMGAFNEANCR